MTRRRPGADASRAPDHDRLDAVRRVYDGWARLYDWNPVLPLVRPARREAVEALGLSPGDTVVDMGTGTGANLGLLREAVGPDGTVVGIDLSPRMLGRARRRVDRHGWDNVVLVRGDVREPPLDGPVDGVVSSFVVVMYEAPDRLVERWADLLDDGSMANVYAGPSDGAFAPAVDALLAGYLRLFEAGWDVRGAEPGPLGIVADRGRRARAALDARAAAATHGSRLFGLLHLDVGTFAADGAGPG